MYLFGHLIYRKGNTAVHWEKEHLLLHAGLTGCPYGKKKSCSLSHITHEKQFQQTADLSMNGKQKSF